MFLSADLSYREEHVFETPLKLELGVKAWYCCITHQLINIFNQLI